MLANQKMLSCHGRDRYLSLSRNVGESGNVEFQAKNVGYRSTPKAYTNISKIFEFSKYNLLIFS